MREEKEQRSSTFVSFVKECIRNPSNQDSDVPDIDRNRVEGRLKRTQGLIFKVNVFSIGKKNTCSHHFWRCRFEVSAIVTELSNYLMQIIRWRQMVAIPIGISCLSKEKIGKAPRYLSNGGIELIKYSLESRAKRSNSPAVF